MLSHPPPPCSEPNLESGANIDCCKLYRDNYAVRSSPIFCLLAPVWTDQLVAGIRKNCPRVDQTAAWTIAAPWFLGKVLSVVPGALLAALIPFLSSIILESCKLDHLTSSHNHKPCRLDQTQFRYLLNQLHLNFTVNPRKGKVSFG
jgi:hypothetical protein